LVFGKDDFIIEGELFINNKTFVKNSISIELNPRPNTGNIVLPFEAMAQFISLIQDN